MKAVASFCLLPDLKLQLLPPVPGPPLGLGMAWAVAIQSCSTVPVLGFPAPRALSHSTELLLGPAGAGSCLAGLGLRGGQKQLQPWSLTILGSAVANSCILGNACGSGNVQYPSPGHCGVHCACLGTCRRSTEGISVGVAGVSRIQARSLQQAPEYLARGQGSHNSCAPLLMA